MKPCGRPSATADILDDAPVLARLAGAVDRLVDLDDAALDLRDGALVLFLQTARQHDVGVPRGVAQEEIDHDEELELVEAARDERIVGQRHLRVEADAEQTLDLAGVDLAEHLVGVDAGSGEVALVDAPDAGDVAAVLRIGDLAPAG